jgi:3-phosphoshikimate 1-carboxyvinyltransferase
VIAAALSNGSSKIENIIFSDDIIATCGGMEALGAEIIREENALIVKGNGSGDRVQSEIQCNESGSTLRFLIPLGLLTEKKITFHGKGKLVDRPLEPYFHILDKQNIKYEYNGLPLTVEGKLKPGDFHLTGNVSSQFITGLLYTLPLLDGDSKIFITTELESKGYVDLTLDILEKYGIKVKNNDYKEFHIEGNQEYTPRDYRVEGDFSQGAFWIVAGLLGGDVQCDDLDMNSYQGDKEIVDLVEKMGGSLSKDKNSINVKTSDTQGIVIDASQCPDIVPILTVLAALSKGRTEIINAARLRIKESDRLKAIATELNKLGADVQEKEEGLVIYGKERLKGGVVDSWNDHRIVMALAIASIRCTDPVMITNSDAIRKSYPGFFDDFKKLGGKVDEWHVGE